MRSEIRGWLGDWVDDENPFMPDKSYKMYRHFFSLPYICGPIRLINLLGRSLLKCIMTTDI